MDYFQTVIKGIVEGITEFLPVSSTAHLKYANGLMHIDDSDPFIQMFDVIIQLGAILSVVVLYYKKFFDFSKSIFYIKLIIAVIPALIFGAILKKYIDTALDNLTFIACVMIGGGIILLFIDNLFTKNIIDDDKKITFPRAFVIGCFQVLAIVFPGLSRSAATIIGGMSQKLTRRLAAEFSFFLAVPTMAAASAKSFLDVYKESPSVLNAGNYSQLAVGFVVSFIVALIAVKFFITYLQKHGFKAFGVYRIILGAVMLILIYQGYVK